MLEFKNVKITKSSRRSIAIMVHPDATVEVRAPKFIPEFAIKAFIKSKEDWIEKRVEFVRKNKALKKQFVNGERFQLLGKDYTLLIGNYTVIEIKDGNILFPLGMVSHGREMLEKWYVRQAKVIIKNLVDEYSKSMGTSYNGLTFSDTSSKWGSCTHDNRLQFNWRLVMTPLLVVRYVVIHELAHTFEKNHSAKFWNKVRSVNPSYKAQIKWLKLHGGMLKF